MFSHVDKFLVGFIDFLNSGTRDFDRESDDKKRKKKPISDVYKEAIYRLRKSSSGSLPSKS